MGDLAQWAKDNSPFIKLSDGESVTGIFNGYEKSKYRGKPLIEYNIGGKILSSSSGRLANCIDSINQGDEIKITRFGEGMQTTYEVEMIKSIKPTDEEQAVWDES